MKRVVRTAVHKEDERAVTRDGIPEASEGDASMSLINTRPPLRYLGNGRT